MPKIKGQDPKETKAHILAIARQQFMRKGYAASSINDIVGATTVTKPTVYYHFKNKEGLFAALVEDAYERCYQERFCAVEPKASIEEQIYQVIAADFSFCLEEPDLVRFVIALTFALPEDKPLDLKALHTRDYEFFRSIIERGIASKELKQIDAGEVALALQGTIIINIMSYLKMHKTPEFLSLDRAKALTEILLTGIKASAKKKVG
ncbi:MAG: TetR/AcrR family transcriptional regulator [Acidobacteria bacterium]|nr:TetR/AcrR family transcriptional regulator [Acidobacteriota bacterium]